MLHIWCQEIYRSVSPPLPSFLNLGLNFLRHFLPAPEADAILTHAPPKLDPNLALPVQAALATTIHLKGYRAERKRAERENKFSPKRPF